MVRVSVDKEKLSLEIKEAIIHKAYFSFVCKYFYEVSDMLVTDKMRHRFERHDESKFWDTLEFVSLASIIHTTNDMKDITNVLDLIKMAMISYHWANNKHHYECDPKMDPLSLREMAVDLQARAVQMNNRAIDYLDAQQHPRDKRAPKRYQFNAKRNRIIRKNLGKLENRMRNIDVPKIGLDDVDGFFERKDSIVSSLLRLPELDLVSMVETEHLVLAKNDDQGYIDVSYTVYDKITKERIGEITMFCNSKLYYSISKKEYEKELLQGFEGVLYNASLEVCKCPNSEDPTITEYINVLELMDRKYFDTDHIEGQGVMSFKIKQRKS